jgi:hypothetical protein
VFPTDIRIAVAPEETYRELVARAPAARWQDALAGPALQVSLLAVIVPLMATHTVSLSLVLISAIAWVTIPATQIAMALVTIGPARRRPVAFARAFELWFAGHAPFTLWLLLLPIIMGTRVGFIVLLAVTFAVPVCWSAFIEAAYCRVVLGATPARARAKTALHQAIMLTVVGSSVIWAAGGVDSVTSWLARTLTRFLG